MLESIVIDSDNLGDKTVNMLFKPINSDEVVNLGDVNLPLTFEPHLLLPPQEIYGFYTITILESNCTYYLKVPEEIDG